MIGLRSGRRQVGLIEVALAIPPGSSLAPSQLAFLDAATGLPQLASERADRRANLLEFVRILARQASWLSTEADPRATARPTRAKVCELAGFSVSTWKRCRAWWARHGYLGIVRQGRSEAARKMSRRTDVEIYDGNDAAVYALCIPRKSRRAHRRASRGDGSEPPQGSPINRVDPHARDADVENPDSQEPGGTALRAGSQMAARTPGRTVTPVALARHLILQRLSDKAVLALWRPFRDAGWTASDWLWAINWRPDNTPHRKDLSEVRRPAGWAKWRLSFWMHGGKPVLSRSQRAAVRRQAEHAQRQAEQLPARRAGAAPGPEIDQLRERRNWKRKGT